MSPCVALRVARVFTERFSLLASTAPLNACPWLLRLSQRHACGPFLETFASQSLTEWRKNLYKGSDAINLGYHSIRIHTRWNLHHFAEATVPSTHACTVVLPNTASSLHQCCLIYFEYKLYVKGNPDFHDHCLPGIWYWFKKYLLEKKKEIFVEWINEGQWMDGWMNGRQMLSHVFGIHKMQY